MNVDKLNNFKKRCIAVGKIKRGLSEQDAEDFAQEYLLMLTIKGWRQTVDQASIDFVRKRFGRTGAFGSISRKVIPITFTDLDVKCGQNASERIIGTDTKHGGDSQSFEESIRGAVRQDRIIFYLIYKWGFTNADIGEILGVSESRISQLHNTALSSQKKRILQEKSRETQRETKQVQSGKIPYGVQERSDSPRTTFKGLEKVFEGKRQRMGSFESKKIQQAICRVFRVKTF